MEVEGCYPFKFRPFCKKQSERGLLKLMSFFPDLRLFLSSVRYFMKNTDQTTQTFTDQGVFCLRKLVAKVKAQIASDG